MDVMTATVVNVASHYDPIAGFARRWEVLNRPADTPRIIAKVQPDNPGMASAAEIHIVLEGQLIWPLVLT